MDRDHSTSLSGAIDALKASTLRLPVVEAKVRVCIFIYIFGAEFSIKNTELLIHHR